MGDPKTSGEDVAAFNVIAARWGLGEVVAIEPLHQGRENRTLRWDLPIGSAVFRCPLSRARAARAREVYPKEALLYRALRDRTAVPTPAWAHADTTETLFSHPYLLVEWREGSPLDQALDSLDECAALRIIETCGRHLAAIHTLDGRSLDEDERGLIPTWGSGERDGMIADWFVDVEWLKITTALAAGELDALRVLGAGAIGTLPRAVPRGLLHGDYRGANILIDTMGPTVSGVCDVELAHWGLVEYDLVKMGMWTLSGRDRLWRRYLDAYREAAIPLDGWETRLLFYRAHHAISYLRWASDRQDRQLQGQMRVLLRDIAVASH